LDSKRVATPLNEVSALLLGRSRDYGATTWGWSAGIDVARTNVAAPDDYRLHGFAELGGAFRRSRGLVRTFSLRTQGSLANIGNADVARLTSSLGAVAALGPLRVRLSTQGGITNIGDDTSAAATFERFNIGGLAPPLYDERLIPQRISEPALPSQSAIGNAFVSHRISASKAGLPGALYAAWFKVYDPNGSWQRLLGVEGEQHFAPISFVSLPHVSLTYGAAYSLDPPRRYRWTLYGGARYAP
jgi:hypothetical protein